ncbi:unnamed protein product, partial [Tilletia caries]
MWIMAMTFSTFIFYGASLSDRYLAIVAEEALSISPYPHPKLHQDQRNERKATPKTRYRPSKRRRQLLQRGNSEDIHDPDRTELEAERETDRSNEQGKVAEPTMAENQI